MMTPRYLLSVVALLTSGTRLVADDWQAAQRARELIVRQVNDINKRARDVDAKLQIAVTGNFGEMQKWQELAQEVSAYAQTFDGTIETVDQQVKNFIDAAPSANLPAIHIGSPFTSYISKAQARIKEIERAQTELDQKIGQIDQEIAKFQGAIEKGTREAFTNTLSGFLPTEEQLLAEGGVIVFGAYFGPPGIAAAALAVGATIVFNQYVGFYYESKSLADQGKAFTDMIQVLQRKRQQLSEARSSYGPALSEMKAIENALQKHQSTYEQLRDKLEAKVKGWTGYVASARRRRDSELQSEMQDELTRKVEPIRSGQCWPGTEPPKIQPDEWRGPAGGPIGQLNSAVTGALDGGDPANVVMTLESVARQRRKIHEDATKKSKEAWERYYEAYRSYWVARRAAERAASQRLQSVMTYEQRQAIWASLAATIRSLEGPLKSPASAAAMAQRELRIVNLTNGQISTAWNLLAQRLDDGARGVETEFAALWSERLAEMAECQVAYAEHSSPAWYAYWQLKYLERQAERIDWEVQHSLDWGGSVPAILAGLRNKSREARDAGQTLGTELKASRSALTQWMGAGTRAQGAIESFEAQYGLLLEGGRGAASISWYAVSKEDWEMPAYFVELRERSEMRIQWLYKRFEVEEPAWLDEADKLEAEQIARAFDKQAEELQYVVDCQNLFRARLTTAIAQISPIARQHTGDALDTPRQGSAAQAAEAVLRRPEWMALAEVADKFPEEARLPLGQYNPSPWERQTARMRLQQLCIWLGQYMNKEMKDYIQAKRYGGFAEVPEAKVEEINRLWLLLDPAMQAWDARVGDRQPKLVGAIEEILQLWAPVSAAYAKVPSSGQREIAGQYSAVGNDILWVTSYLRRFAQGMQPFANLSYDDQIRKTMTEYPKDLKRRNDAIEAARRLFEQQQREAEARRKAEEEQRRREEEAREKLVQQVQSFYNEFKTNYERRSAAGVVALLDDDWSAGDGTTIADLEETLDNSFRVFDEVQCSIGGLQVLPQADGTAKATYTMQIIGHIYRNRIKHEDSSDVTDILHVDGGKPRILKTTQGRFWYQQ